MDPIKVGMSECKVAGDSALITAVGLGSCIGIVLYDAIHKIGGLAHIMLPKASEAKDRSNPAKFADTAVELLIKKMERKGAERRAIKAKIFGGANMFPSVQGAGQMGIGERNTTAVRDELKRQKIRIVAEEVGGYSGRTIILDTDNGDVTVRDIRGKARKY